MAMKITIRPDLYLKYANLPDFHFRLSGLEDDDYAKPQLVPYALGKSYLHIPTRDGLACDYQVVCQERADGNTNFAWGGFKSGWSSRASVINTVFDTQYVDCSGNGLDVRRALEHIYENYAEPVAIYMDISCSDIEYGIAPFHERKRESFDNITERYQVMNPTHPDFVEAAMEWFHLAPKQTRHKTCYQCHAATAWLAPDGRCKKCTRLTPEEVSGA